MWVPPALCAHPAPQLQGGPLCPRLPGGELTPQAGHTTHQFQSRGCRPGASSRLHHPSQMHTPTGEASLGEGTAGTTDREAQLEGPWALLPGTHAWHDWKALPAPARCSERALTRHWEHPQCGDQCRAQGPCQAGLLWNFSPSLTSTVLPPFLHAGPTHGSPCLPLAPSGAAALPVPLSCAQPGGAGA